MLSRSRPVRVAFQKMIIRCLQQALRFVVCLARQAENRGFDSGQFLLIVRGNHARQNVQPNRQDKENKREEDFRNAYDHGRAV